MTAANTKALDSARAGEQPTISAREMAHRLNNTLAVIQSIITQTARKTPDPKAFAKALEGRIGAMANANRSVVEGKGAGANPEALIRQELASHVGESNARVSLSGPPAALPPGAVVAFALVVHELATNAVKFGALSNATGKIDVTWAVKPGPQGQPEFSMLWRESGGPIVQEPEQKGFGTVLLKRGIDDCKSDCAFDSAGVTCKVTLPI